MPSKPPSDRDVLITGVGLISPLGLGRAAFWQALVEGRSGIRPVAAFGCDNLPVRVAAEVSDFDPKEYVRPRKSLKVMSRDIQLAFAATDFALADAGLAAGSVDPERFGVVFGADVAQTQPLETEAAYRKAMSPAPFNLRRWGEAFPTEIYPLYMLKQLPNMAACHVAIAHDARGPNNTITMSESSSLLAVEEAARVIERGHADVMLSGGTAARVQPTLWMRQCALGASLRNGDPARVSRPFDAGRDGFVIGEGAAVLVLESRRHAERRQARVLARILGGVARHCDREGSPAMRTARIAAAVESVLRVAGLTAGDLGHVNAHGNSTREDDAVEAQALRAVLGDVPVTAPKGHFGSLGVAAGGIELAATVLSVAEGRVPPTLNYERPDPECPVNVVRGGPLEGRPPVALKLSFGWTGPIAAMVVACE